MDYLVVKRNTVSGLLMFRIGVNDDGHPVWSGRAQSLKRFSTKEEALDVSSEWVFDDKDDVAEVRDKIPPGPWNQ